MTKCEYCGTNGDHYCPADVAHGPEDGTDEAAIAEQRAYYLGVGK
jgi:hypothetical protein